MSRFSLTPKQLLEKLVKETVKSVLKEQDFDVPATAPGKRSALSQNQQQQKAPVVEPFNFVTFMGKPDLNSKTSYTEKRLKLAPGGDQGSSRLVFMLNDKQVLKLAHVTNAHAGMEQNKKEMQGCKRHAYFFTQVDDAHSDPKGEWIVAEFANPINAQQFKNLMKMDFEVFTSALKVAFSEVAKNITDQNKADYETAKNLPTFQRVVQSAKECKLVPAELTKLENWGVTKDGRLVMLDSGYTDDLVGKIANTRVA